MLGSNQKKSLRERKGKDNKMINSVLAISGPGPIEIFLIILMCAIPIAFVVWIIKMITKNKNENIRLRLEVGKLADELEKLRKNQKPKRQNDSYSVSD